MDTNHIITILTAIFASTGFWTLITNLINNRRAKKSAEVEMILGLAHDRIYDLCREYIRRGSITHDEYDNLRYLYEPYKRLGGNGTGKRLWEEVEKLPIKEEEDA